MLVVQIYGAICLYSMELELFSSLTIFTGVDGTHLFEAFYGVGTVSE